jgi:hypothetical protein
MWLSCVTVSVGLAVDADSNGELSVSENRLLVQAYLTKQKEWMPELFKVTLMGMERGMQAMIGTFGQLSGGGEPEAMPPGLNVLFERITPVGIMLSLGSPLSAKIIACSYRSCVCACECAVLV